MGSQRVRRRVALLVASVLAITIAADACSDGGSSHEGGAVVRSKLARVTKPDVAPADLHASVAGDTAFALDLYQQVRTQGGNLAFSPASISAALSMASVGARGATLDQMRSVLHLTLPGDRLHAALNALDLALTEPRPKPEDAEGDPLTLSIANAIWGQAGYPFLSDFLDVLARDYGAGMHVADFARDADAVRSKINAWVADRTNHKIRDLVPKGVLDDLTRLVLVNAVYFKGSWLAPFDPKDTADGPFHPLTGDDVTVTMMRESEHLPYTSGDGWQAVDLPYIGGASMTLLVPESGRLDAVEQSLDPALLATIASGLQERTVNLAMPKFDVRRQLALGPTLQAMGMTDAFKAPPGPGTADFTGITRRNELFVTDVVHEATVVVDERGTEAAAATAVTVGTTAAPGGQPVTLTIDRPFLFLIRDTSTGVILFMGRVTNPTS